MGGGYWGTKFWCWYWEGCVRGMEYDVEFVYQFRICSTTEENHGKPESNWPLAGPFVTHPIKASLKNIYEFSPYLKENTTLYYYKDQLFNAVQGNNRRLESESYKTDKYKMRSSWSVTQALGYIQLPLGFEMLKTLRNCKGSLIGLLNVFRGWIQTRR
jgi:hypothetical protein